MSRPEGEMFETQAGNFEDVIEEGEFGTTSEAGALKQGAAVADAAALTSAQISGGESPTEAEFNALQADVAALRTKLNALLGSLRGAGKPLAP